MNEFVRFFYRGLSQAWLSILLFLLLVPLKCASAIYWIVQIFLRLMHSWNILIRIRNVLELVRAMEMCCYQNCLES